MLVANTKQEQSAQKNTQRAPDDIVFHMEPDVVLLREDFDIERAPDVTVPYIVLTHSADSADSADYATSVAHSCQDSYHTCPSPSHSPSPSHTHQQQQAPLIKHHLLEPLHVLHVAGGRLLHTLHRLSPRR